MLKEEERLDYLLGSYPDRSMADLANLLTAKSGNLAAAVEAIEAGEEVAAPAASLKPAARIHSPGSLDSLWSATADLDPEMVMQSPVSSATQFADVILVSGDGLSFPAHRALLAARSPALGAALAKDGNQVPAVFPDLRPWFHRRRPTALVSLEDACTDLAACLAAGVPPPKLSLDHIQPLLEISEVIRNLVPSEPDSEAGPVPGRVDLKPTAAGASPRPHSLPIPGSLLRQSLQYIYTDRVALPSPWTTESLKELAGVAESLELNPLAESIAAVLAEAGDLYADDEDRCAIFIDSNSSYEADIKALLGAPAIPPSEFDDLPHPPPWPDVVLGLDGVPVYGHRAILAAASEFFAGLFSARMVEGHAAVVPLPDLEYASTWLCLDAIYSPSGRLSAPLNGDDIVSTFAAASRLIVGPLERQAVALIKRGLEPSNALTILAGLGDASASLRSHTIQYIYANWEAIRDSEDWSELEPETRAELEETYTASCEAALDDFLTDISYMGRREIVDSVRSEVRQFLIQAVGELQAALQSPQTMEMGRGVMATLSAASVWLTAPPGPAARNGVIQPAPRHFGRGLLTEEENQPGKVIATNPWIPPDGPEDPLPARQITVELGSRHLFVTAAGLSLDFSSKFAWVRGPRLKDAGDVTGVIPDAAFAFKFDIYSAGLGVPALLLSGYQLDIGKPDVSFRPKSMMATVYSTLFGLFRTKLRKTVLDILTTRIEANAASLTAEINAWGHQLLQQQRGL